MSSVRKLRASLGVLLVLSAAAQEAKRPEGLSVEPLPSEDTPELAVEHANCLKFVDREKWSPLRETYRRGRTTEEVVDQLMPLSPRSVTVNAATLATSKHLATSSHLIDRHIFAELDRQRVTPAPRTTDAEFIRRVTLDLTGRIPTVERLTRFLNDPAADKRTRLIEELIASPEWVDKWTMYYGDLFKNTARNSQISRGEQGRNQFYEWIRESVRTNKRYDVMARELISATGDNNWTDGDINFLIGSRVTGGPAQDIYDQQAVSVAETFLGLGHLNCILCHDGRGHLNELSLWGSRAKRSEAWELAAFFARSTVRTRATSTPGTVYYALLDDGRADYTLNTTTGNRPAREPLPSGRTVAPRYIFSNQRPASGEPYRAALARSLTADRQFARAAVNYLWAEFFGRGLVEPLNQFDPARLDPDNPPEAPWTLQASHPRLLNELAQAFIESGYNIRTLMRLMTTSEAYQLSSRYAGNWNPAWEPLFARKLVRRLWAEELHDAIALSSGVLPVYRINTFSGPQMLDRSTRNVSLAMQFPDTVGLPDGQGVVAQFLDSFFRPNREDQERLRDGSVLQALNLMNDSFVNNRIRPVTTNGADSLLRTALMMPDNQRLVETLYLTVLSRYPTDAEMRAALATFTSNVANLRQAKAEDLLWSLYNKVDFIFNY